MRYVLCLITAAALAGTVCAETLEGVGKQIDDIQNGRNTGNQIKTLRVSGNATIAGTLTPGSMGASTLSGNIAVARMTNALPSAGSYIGGNIPVAAVTNALKTGTYSVPAANIDSGNIAAARISTALGTSGSSIGGNIPLAALTNAITGATGALVTNDVLVAGGTTNRWILAPIGGKYIVVSITGL
jgi:hypothetical protein